MLYRKVSMNSKSIGRPIANAQNTVIDSQRTVLRLPS